MSERNFYGPTRCGVWVSVCFAAFAADVLLVPAQADAPSRVNQKLCKRASDMLQNLTRQQVEQMKAAPAAARVVRDCLPFFANNVGTGESCLREQCKQVVADGIAVSTAATPEQGVSMCLDSAEDLIVINKTIELNYLNYTKSCRNVQQ